MLNRKDKAIIVLIVLLVVSYPFIVKSQTPPGPNTLEHGQGLNFPTITAINGFYLGVTNLTDRLQGTWDVALTAPTLDTGQGANELYDMDQNVLTTSTPEFAGLQASWFELNGDNRSSWPVGGTGSIEELSFSYLAFTNSSGSYIVNGSSGLIIGESANASDVFNWIDGNLTSPGTFVVKAGTYNLNGVSTSNDWEMICEEGTIFNITANTGAVVFGGDVVVRNANFTTIVDGNKHIDFEANAKLIDCDFHIPIDCLVELQCFMESSASSPNRIEIYRSTLKGGKIGAEHLGLLDINSAMNELIVHNMIIEDLICNGSTKGRISVFESWDSNIVTIDIKDILIKNVNARYQGCVFLGLGTSPTFERITFDNYKQLGGTWAANTTHFSQLSMTGSPAHIITMNNIELHERFHPIIKARQCYMNNIRLISDGQGPTSSGSWDLGTQDIVGGVALINGFYARNASLDMNTGWKRLELSNFVMNGSRLWVGDEGTEKSVPKWITVSNGVWTTEERPARFTGSIQLAFSQELDLRRLEVADVVFDYQNYIIEASVPPTNESLIILDNVYIGPEVDSQNPKLITGDPRDNDNQKIWIFNSDITAWKPPLCDWNPIRPNDRFENVRWVDTTGDVVTYSNEFLTASEWVISYVDHGTYDYYYAYETATGQVLTDTNASAIVEDAKNSLTSGNGGIIRFGPYSFQNLSVVFDHGSTKMIELIGSGQRVTYLLSDLTQNIIHIKDGSRVNIRDMTIGFNDNSVATGHVIYGEGQYYTGDVNGISLYMSELANLNLGGSNSSCWGLWLVNPSHVDLRNIEMKQIYNGLRLTQYNNVTHYGNSKIDNVMIGHLDGGVGARFDSVSLAPQHYLNLIHIGKLECQSETGVSNSTGVVFQRVRNIKTEYLHLEHYDIGVNYLNAPSRIYIDGGYFGISGITTPISGSAQFSEIRNVAQYYTYSRGNTSASNDDWITHGLSGIPTNIQLTVNQDDANYIAQVKALNSTMFQITLYDDTADAAETVDKNILWIALFDPI